MAEQRFKIGQRVHVVIEGERCLAIILSYYAALDLYDIEVRINGKSTVITVRGSDIIV